MKEIDVVRYIITNYFYVAIRKIIPPLLCLAIVSCARPYVDPFVHTPYVPGSDLSVKTLSATMTPDTAVMFLGKYINEYVDSERKWKARGPLSQSMSGGSVKPNVTTEGFSYILVKPDFQKGTMTVNMEKQEVKFVDITHIVIRSEKKRNKEKDVILYNRQHDGVLSCDVTGSEHLLPKLLAAIEVLCPNLVSEPMVKDFSCCSKLSVKEVSQ
jgi:hypothetical protein